MRPRCSWPLAALAASAALAAAFTAPARAASTPSECAGLQKCIAVPGPWVAVPSRGEVDYLLVCPKKAVAAGTEALVSSQQIHVSFDGIPGSPVAYGRTTNFEVLFRAVAGDHRAGSFQPLLGCLPTPSGARNTTAVPVVPLGAPLDLYARSIVLAPGTRQAASLGCGRGESLVDSWTATAFALARPPQPGLAAAVRVQDVLRGGRAFASAQSSDALPVSEHALVQLGVRCTPG